MPGLFLCRKNHAREGDGARIGCVAAAFSVAGKIMRAKETGPGSDAWRPFFCAEKIVRAKGRPCASPEELQQAEKIAGVCYNRSMFHTIRSKFFRRKFKTKRMRAIQR